MILGANITRGPESWSLTDYWLTANLINNTDTDTVMSVTVLYCTAGRSNLGLTAGLMPLVCLAHVVFFPVAFPVSKILDWTVGSHPGITLRSRKAKIEEVLFLPSFHSYVSIISSPLPASTCPLSLHLPFFFLLWPPLLIYFFNLLFYLTDYHHHYCYLECYFSVFPLPSRDLKWVLNLRLWRPKECRACSAILNSGNAQSQLMIPL